MKKFFGLILSLLLCLCFVSFGACSPSKQIAGKKIAVQKRLRRMPQPLLFSYKKGRAPQIVCGARHKNRAALAKNRPRPKKGVLAAIFFGRAQKFQEGALLLGAQAFHAAQKLVRLLPSLRQLFVAEKLRKRDAERPADGAKRGKFRLRLAYI